MRRATRAILMACALSVGCAAPGSKTKTQKEAAAEQWAGTRATVLASLANDQYQSGNYDKSRQTVDQALALNPRSARLHVLSARLDIEQGRLDAADRSLATAGELDPRDAQIDCLRGVVRQRWQRPAEAMAFYGAAATKQPDEPAFALAQAEMLVALDRRPEALRFLLRRAEHFEHSAAIRDAAAQLLQADGQLAQAITYYRQASVLDNEDLGIRERLGLALYEAGEFREAASQLARVTPAPGDKPRADLMLVVARCELELGDGRAARRRFDEVIAIEPANFEACLGSAQASLMLSDPARAEFWARRAVTFRPRSVDAWVVLGYARMRLNRDADAADALTRAAALEPGDATTLGLLARLSARRGETAAARAYLGRAVGSRPDEADSTRALAGITD